MRAPLPYSVEGEGQDTVGILSIDNHYVAFLKGRAKESQDDTADFIVRACNSHYELVEALEKLVREADEGNPFCSIGHLIEHVVPQARAALAKAKGES